MSLEIIEYNTANCSESELFAIIKQRTGLELKSLDSGSGGTKTITMRFPDMETAQSIKSCYFNDSGTFFIDVANHFLCYSIKSGLDNYSYVDGLYKMLVFDYNGKLVNICYTMDIRWGDEVNVLTGNCAGDDITKSNITLVPLRTYASTGLHGATSVKTFVKNCYVNYERKFQKGLKFADENGNKFVTLGGYLLYKTN